TTRLTERIIAILPKSGRLIKIKDDEIAINLGKRDGLQVGSRLRIERSGKEIGKAKVTAIDHFISTALPETKGWEKTFGLGDFISVENAESSK
ncbi:MAG: hypothetical protein K8R21_14545, partial [Leptospira sp.]|nr:hypothetical protein [Leptospira sp.]